MERERPREIQKESEDKLEELRRELAELKERKKQKEFMEKQATEIIAAVEEEQPIDIKDVDFAGLDEIEARLNKIDTFLVEQLDKADEKTLEKHSIYLDEQLQTLEQEIIGERDAFEAEVSPYEQVLMVYPWLEEQRYEFMYTIPDKKEKPSDYESWKQEWSKVVFDYAKYAILHIMYVRKLNSEMPFSKFTNRESSIKEIAEELINQKLAKWLSKKRDQLRVYWKTLEVWADEIYEWAYDLGKIEPILIYEIREAKLEFSSLPKEDLEAIFKILAKEKRAKVIKLDDGELSIKIKID